MRTDPRLLIVSAHYPPDFVSGGTLVPARLAAALSKRGFDVQVYAGSLSTEREPLNTFSTSEDGIPVRWVVIEPWIEWSSRRNFDNPDVTADFSRHLREVAPDLVHFHSLQALGAGLLPAAKAAGAATVVTMHDFWWCCARQFLVRPDWQPCSLVVDCGRCPCEVGRDVLDERNRDLRAALRAADLVLTPSEAAARVLAANGVPADRLQLDGNGVPAPAAQSPAAPAGGGETVRFAYLGGDNPMKGAGVLCDALTLLLPAGWTLDAYGLAPFLQRSRRGALPGAVTVREPFTPGEIEDVFARTDVLLLPSLMRETFSLATREALSRGVAVICTDSLGPEEVVEHERNGLVVRSADPEDLAAAMRRIIDDRSLLADLRRAAPEVTLRSPESHADSLAERLHELLDKPRATERGGASPIRDVLFVCGIDGAPLRYRAWLPAEALALHGVRSQVRHYRDPALAALADQVDAVVFYRVPATVQVLALIERIRGTSPHVSLVFDVDDLIFDPELEPEIPALQLLSGAERDLWLEGVHRYRTTLEACDYFVGSTDPLCDHASLVTGLPTGRFDNGVGTVLARAAEEALDRPRRPGPLRVGYLSGTTTHDRDWAMIEAAVLDALDGTDVELWLIGHLRTSPAVERLGARLHRLPIADWLELPGLVRDLDLNLAPLEASGRFNEAKSAIKWLEAALVETPTIASPTQPFREAIDDGRTGLLAASAPEWADAITTLLGDEDARARMGRAARRDALLRWSPHLQGARYLALLESARAAGRTGRSSSWQPVALDEPPVDTHVEGYPSDAFAPLAVMLPEPDGLNRRELARRALGKRLEESGRILSRDGGRAALRWSAATLRASVARRRRTHRDPT